MACTNTNRIDGHQNCRPPHSSSFQQEFVITHVIFSKKVTLIPEILNQKRSQLTEKPGSAVGVTVFYQTHDGGWKECEGDIIASIPIRNKDPRWLTNSVINITPAKLISVMIRGWIPVKDELRNNNYTRTRYA
ncbi:unnamed protein product [Adineta ricciae]|uniref:Uncharacterized protein n=1 Tax=Adineta ricciae TaxID=249248 RepID=A0A814J6X0_ADIRI|nr:unnamed protein product [Adineta ricciae]CAF1060186.1 unnamed protein product [Adineta ricciae]